MEVYKITWQKIVVPVLGVLLTVSLFTAVEGFDDGNFDSSTDAPVADNTATAEVDQLGPFGGNLLDVAIDSTNDIVYTIAKDSPNGFYRSTDGGTNWTGLSGMDVGGGIAVEVDQTTGNVYANFAQGIYLSTDHGVTLTRISTDSGTGILFANGVLLSAAQTAGAILVSADSGVTFSTATVTAATDQTIWDIDYSAADDSYYVLTLDASDQVHLYHSTTAGATWAEVTAPAFSSSASEARFAVNPLDANNLFITGGNNNNAYYTTTGVSGWTDSGVASSGVTIDQTGRIWVAEQHSDDGGVTWENYDDNNTTSAIGGRNVTVDPSDANVVYADAMPGLAKSNDGGATWTDINDGLSGVTITDLSQATDKDNVWAAAYNGIAKTSNFTSGNPTWEFPVLEEPGEGIWVDPNNSDVAVAGLIGSLKRTNDGGVTWSDNLVGSLIGATSQVDDIIADVNDADILYAGISNGDPNQPKVGQVIVSHDQGLTWEDMNLLDDGSAQTIAQASNGDLYVGIGTESELSGVNGIYKYSNGSWTDLATSPDEDIVKVIVDPSDDNIVYAIASVFYNNGTGTNFGFYKSTDAGATWTKITDGLDHLRSFNSLTAQASTTPTTLYLGAENYYGQGVLLKSSDGGTTWGILYTGLQDETFYTLMFDGVTLGSSRGLFVVNSRAALTLAAKKRVTVGSKATINITLKDAATNSKLKHKKVKILRKTKTGYKLVETARTNNKGKIAYQVTLNSAKKYYFKAKWTPTGSTADEYVKVTSSALKITGIN
ncbi:MAG: sialidase family protein [Patescibacteria group bacterium]